jgi:hypothetical protein
VGRSRAAQIFPARRKHVEDVPQIGHTYSYIENVQQEITMGNSYADHILEIIDKASLNPAFERFIEAAKFLDDNFSAVKVTPKTIPYPPPQGYGSFGKDVTEEVCVSRRSWTLCG